MSSTTATTTLHLSMFERVVISVLGAAMVWVGVTVTKNAVAIARLEVRTALVATEVGIIKTKIDQNILPVAKLRLDALEGRQAMIETMMRALQTSLDEHNNHTRRAQ